MSLLLLNIGNTHTQVALSRAPGRVRLLGTVATADLKPGRLPALLARHRRLPVLAACVVPRVRRLLAEQGLRVTWLSAKLDLGLDFSGVDSRTVGADRVANAVAAAAELPLPAVVLDCGTAVTTVVVDRRRRFLGGAIMPGRRLARAALAQGTGQLPLVALTPRAGRALGRNTVEAIRAGVDQGVLGAAARLATLARQQFRSPLSVVAVGGDRRFFASQLDGVALGPPDFTLRGLAHAAARLGLV